MHGHAVLPAACVYSFSAMAHKESLFHPRVAALALPCSLNTTAPSLAPAGFSAMAGEAPVYRSSRLHSVNPTAAVNEDTSYLYTLVRRDECLLCCAVLCCAVLCCAVPCCAVLSS